MKGRFELGRASASLAVGLVIATAIGACAPRIEVTQGECRPVHGSDVCVWSETADSRVRSFGATIPIGSIENAPADAPMVWPPAANATIPLPENVAAATGFKVLTIYWEAHGHPPGPFLTPHLDFHFYAMTPAEIDAIDCADLTKPSAAPAAYELPDIEIPGIGNLVGLCVPKMGMHALASAEMAATVPFTGTMVVGYNVGAPIFIEPMISKESLMARKSFTLAVPAVPGAPTGVLYPTTFRADYDSTANAYRFVFSGMGTGTK